MRSSKISQKSENVIPVFNTGFAAKCSITKYFFVQPYKKLKIDMPYFRLILLGHHIRYEKIIVHFVIMSSLKRKHCRYTIQSDGKW